MQMQIAVIRQCQYTGNKTKNTRYTSCIHYHRL